MKVRIKNKSLRCYEKEFKVIKMNYDYIVVYDGNERRRFHKDEVEFISEYNYENVILDCKDIIKIRLDRGMSLLLYSKLVSCIESKTEGKIKRINVLKDEYRIIRKGLWEKNLFLVINEEIPLYINIIGRNFDRNFDITIKDMSLEQFVGDCTSEIKQLETLIKEKKALSERYRRALKNVICSRMDEKKFPPCLNSSESVYNNSK